MEFEFQLKFDQALSAVEEAASEGLADGCDHILNVSNAQIPHEIGDLEASGRAGVDGLTGFVTYDSPYAVIQHEDLTFHHDAGRKAKYLEDAVNSEKDKVLAFIGNKIKGAL